MIDGKNICLRSLTKKDFDKTFKWHNDLELKNLTLSHPFPVTDVQEEEWYNSILKDSSNKNVYFGIEDKSNEELVGIIFLSKINMIHQTCWLGIFLGEANARGKGFGKEAVSLIVDYGFTSLNLRKVSLEVVKTNKNAITVYKNIGFVQEGEMKKQVFIDGKYSDLILMSLKEKLSFIMDDKNNFSNKDVDWGKHYDYYEINFRENYNTISKPQNDSHFEMIKSHLKNYLNKNLVFAEIGFGSGLTLRYAAKYFSKVYGLDISPKNVEYTNKELKDEGYTNIDCITFDIMKLNKNFKNKFDVISFIHGLEHFSESDYAILFENIKYYLTENGVFTGALPNDLQFNYRMCPSCNNVFEIDGHLSRHTIGSLKKLFEKNNFQIIHLDDFNTQYFLRYRGLIRTIYYLLRNRVLKTRLNHQLEFIVKQIW